MWQSASNQQRMRMKEQVGFSRKKRPPRGLKGLQLSLHVLTATKEEKNEGHDGQAITSTGRHKKGNGQKVHFHSHKRAGEMRDKQLFMPIVKVLNDKI